MRLQQKKYIFRLSTEQTISPPNSEQTVDRLVTNDLCLVLVLEPPTSNVTGVL